MIVSWCQFHQHFTCNFYAQRFLKCKKTVKSSGFFVVSGSARIKAARRMLMKLTPGVTFIDILCDRM